MRVWELLEVTDDGVSSLDVFSNGTDALNAFMASDAAVILQPIEIRTTAESKKRALARESHYLEARVVALESIQRPARVKET